MELQPLSRDAAPPAFAACAETDRALARIGEELRREVEAITHELPPETRAMAFDNLGTIDRSRCHPERSEGSCAVA